MPLRRGNGQFAHQLVLGADFGIDVEDLAKEAPLVADVLVVPERGGTDVRARRLVLHGSSVSCAAPPAVPPARGHFVCGLGGDRSSVATWKRGGISRNRR